MASPISLSQIQAGWVILGLGDTMNAISYLSDLKEELDYVLNLDREVNNKAIMLEMESDGTLCIQTLLDYGCLYITIFRIYDDKLRPYTYRYRYKEFLTYYLKEMEANRDLYIKEFIFSEEDEEDYVWENENYLDLRRKVMEE